MLRSNPSHSGYLETKLIQHNPVRKQMGHPVLPSLNRAKRKEECDNDVENEYERHKSSPHISSLPLCRSCVSERGRVHPIRRQFRLSLFCRCLEFIRRSSIPLAQGDWQAELCLPSLALHFLTASASVPPNVNLLLSSIAILFAFLRDCPTSESF